MHSYDDVSKKILNEFMKLYAKKHLHEITVKELSERVGIARTAFYNYYADIYEVLESIEDMLIFQLKEMNRSFYLMDLKDNNIKTGFFEQTLQFIRENADWFRILLDKGRDGQFIYKWKNIIKEDFALKFSYENLVFKDENLILEMIASAAIGMYMYWVNNLEKVSPQDMEQEAIYRLCRGFL